MVSQTGVLTPPRGASVQPSSQALNLFNIHMANVLYPLCRKSFTILHHCLSFILTVVDIMFKLNNAKKIFIVQRYL